MMLTIVQVKDNERKRRGVQGSGLDEKGRSNCEEKKEGVKK